MDWPSPRFTDHGDGTVTDHLTGLMWAKDANIWGALIWNSAIDNCYGHSLAGYSDWRLPSVQELLSLIDYEQHDPALPSGHPFQNTDVFEYYWTSGTNKGNTSHAFVVRVYQGFLEDWDKSATRAVWPVRGGR